MTSNYLSVFCILKKSGYIACHCCMHVLVAFSGATIPACHSLANRIYHAYFVTFVCVYNAECSYVCALSFCCAISIILMIFTCFLLALASGNPKDRVPYKSIKDSQVCGFPSGLTFGPPSSFSSSDLKVILDKADDISFCKFKDMSNKVSVFCKFYTSKYCSLLLEYSFPFNTQNMFHKASDH